MPPWPLLLFGVGMIVAAPFFFVSSDPSLRTLALFLAGLGVFFLLMLWAVQASHAAKWRKYIREFGDNTSDPAVRTILGVCRCASDRINPRRIRAALVEAGLQGEHWPLICIGPLDVPEVGEKFFEPEIITPLGGIGKRIIFVPIAAVIVAYYGVQQAGLAPLPHIPIGGFGYLVAMGFAVGALWLWRGVVRPTYIRLAPGMVQVLQYCHGSDTPTIRSYPMDGATLVALRADGLNKKRWVHQVTLLRGDQLDRLDLGHMRHAKETSAKLMDALLSTAPIPPLSDEHLIG